MPHQRHRAVSMRSLGRVVLASIVAGFSSLPGLGCEQRVGEMAAEPRALPPLASVRRLIEPPAGEVSTLSLPRVQIGSETRLVLGAQPRELLLWHQPVEALGETLRVELARPAGSGTSELRIDVWASVEPEAFRDTGLVEARMITTARQRLEVAARVVAVDALADGFALSVPVPEAMRGLDALVNAVARPLAVDARTEWRRGPFAVAAGDRLRFGFGIEPEGWTEGWPPVRFRVFTSAHPGGGEEQLLFDRRLDPARDPRDRRWFDTAVALDSAVGPAVHFRFEARPVAAPEGLVSMRSFPVISAPEIVAGPIARARDDGPWNLVLISLDTLRAKSVGAYGYARDTTPAIDQRLGAQGTRFATVVTPAPFTPPSHMSMLTGLEPCAHRVDDRQDVLPADRITLAEQLRAAGYRSAAFTENGYVVAGAGFARGFDHYFEQLSEESAAPGFIGETFGAAERWLADEGARPFFLFVHTYQVHDPYDPPRSYLDLFANDGLEDGVPEKNRADRDAYDREIRYTDDMVAGFLDTLESRGLAERTLVVVTSDHGEGFAEHFWIGHGFSAHDEAILVPLFLRAPGLVPAGKVIDEPVGLIDLAPSLLELLGVKPLRDLQGQSFVSLVQGSGEAWKPRPLVSRAATHNAVRTLRHKLLRVVKKREETGRQLLFDVRADPGERVDLFAREPAVAQELDDFYRSWLERCDALEARAGETPDAGGLAKPGWLINRDQIDEKLRSLGYVE